MRVPTAPISGGSNTSSRSTTKIIIYIYVGGREELRLPWISTKCRMMQRVESVIVGQRDVRVVVEE
jgi:hypothetical protein